MDKLIGMIDDVMVQIDKEIDRCRDREAVAALREAMAHLDRASNIVFAYSDCD